VHDDLCAQNRLILLRPADHVHSDSNSGTSACPQIETEREMLAMCLGRHAGRILSLAGDVGIAEIPDIAVRMIVR